MNLLRVALPAAIFVAGLVLAVVGGEVGLGAGIVLMGGALLLVLFNLWIRLGFTSERDREREEAARDHFSRTGRWPDE